VSDAPEAQRERLGGQAAGGPLVRPYPGVRRARRGKEHERDRFAAPETVTLSPLPCWEHLSPEEQKEKVAELVREIEEEAAAQREATGPSSAARPSWPS